MAKDSRRDSQRVSCMTAFQEALVYLFQNEGVKYVDDPQDAGGPTKWGVTQKAYSEYLGRQIGKEEIAGLTFEAISPFYFKKYWTPLRCDDIKNKPIAIAVFDCGVLFGIQTAAIFTQQALYKCGAMLKTDGVIGQQTLSVLNMVGLEEFLENLHECVMHRIDIIVEHHPQNEKFKQGWRNRANRLLTLNTVSSDTITVKS